MEEWKDIPGYIGLYEASTCGRIRTKKGKITSSARYPKRVWKQRIMKPKVSTDRYGRHDERVSLWKDGKPHDFLVARLIAATFLGESLSTSLTVNHKDGNPMNNRVDNLEWLSRADNIRYGFMNGQYNTNPITLLSEDGTVLDFISRSAACAYLGRNHSYIARAITTRKTEVYDKSGKKYYIKAVTA